MRGTRIMHVGGWVAVGLLAIWIGLCSGPQGRQPLALAAPEPTAAAEKKPANTQAETQKRDKARGRLPAYYGEVVTPEQREKIYAIQAEFNPKIEQLRQQIEALTKQRDEKIQALLSPEQKKKIEELKATARKSRATKRPSKEKEKTGTQQ